MLAFRPLRAFTLLALASFTLGVPLAPEALAQSPRVDFPVTDGYVLSASYLEGTLYLGGLFNHVGRPCGGFAGVDAATGALVPSPTRVAGQVWAAIPDGSGGWYLGGFFSAVVGVRRNNLARIHADGSLDAWDPSAVGTVHAFLQD